MRGTGCWEWDCIENAMTSQVLVFLYLFSSQCQRHRLILNPPKWTLGLNHGKLKGSPACCASQLGWYGITSFLIRMCTVTQCLGKDASNVSHEWALQILFFLGFLQDTLRKSAICPARRLFPSPNISKALLWPTVSSFKVTTSFFGVLLNANEIGYLMEEFPAPHCL